MKICCLLIFLGFLLPFCERWGTLLLLQQKTEQTETELTAAKADRKALKKRISLLDDEDYVMYLTRKRLCCLYPGETYYSDFTAKDKTAADD